jgi:hypothetical protein
MSSSTIATEGMLEIVDVGEERTIARLPVAKMRFLPRVGERLFLPGRTLGEWELCDVMMVEYFSDERVPGSDLDLSGMGKITIYVRQISKSVDRSIRKTSAT